MPRFRFPASHNATRSAVCFAPAFPSRRQDAHHIAGIINLTPPETKAGGGLLFHNSPLQGSSPLWPRNRSFTTTSSEAHLGEVTPNCTLADGRRGAERTRNKALPPHHALSSLLRQYTQVSKGKLTMWVALSTVPGYVMLGDPCLGALAALVSGTALASGSANCLNQLHERHLDAQMARTKGRPIASGRMSLGDARKFAVLSGTAGVGILALGTNPLTAALAAANIAAYAIAYTRLKVVTPYNTHIGAIVGSVPVLMGCTAAGSCLMAMDPWMLFLIQTLWQFPHFYSLAWIHRMDYLAAGYQMFPLNDTTGKETANMILPYLLGLTALPMLSSAAGCTSFMFVVDSLIPNGILLWHWRKFQANPSKQTARSLFFHLLWQLFALMGLMVYHSRPLVDSYEPLDVESPPAAVASDKYVQPDRNSSSETSHQQSIAFLRFLSRARGRLMELCPHLFIGGLQESCPFEKGASFVAQGNESVEGSGVALLGSCQGGSIVDKQR